MPSYRRIGALVWVWPRGTTGKPVRRARGGSYASVGKVDAREGTHVHRTGIRVYSMSRNDLTVLRPFPTRHGYFSIIPASFSHVIIRDLKSPRCCISGSKEISCSQIKKSLTHGGRVEKMASRNDFV